MIALHPSVMVEHKAKLKKPRSKKGKRDAKLDKWFSYINGTNAKLLRVAFLEFCDKEGLEVTLK